MSLAALRFGTAVAACWLLPAWGIAQATQGESTRVPFAAPPEQPGSKHDMSVQISEYIRCIFQDRDGHMWFGTNSDGVCRYDGAALVFFGIKEGFAGRAAREIVQTKDGAMWFTTERGVSRYQDGKFRTYTTADGLPSDDTWSMMLDRSGTLWVGTREGVCRYAGAGDDGAAAKKELFVAFPVPRAEVEGSATKFDPRLAWSIFEDRDGRIWFGTDGEGARMYDGREFKTFTTKDGLGGNQVRCILGDGQGHIWIGGDGFGVSRFDGKVFRTFTAEDGLGNDRVFSAFEDRAGNMWFSTLADGVTRYDGTSFTVFRQLGNLARTHVQSIFEDRDGTLWFGCSGGLFRFDGTAFVNVTKNGPWRQ